MRPILIEVVGADGEVDWVPDFYASEDNRGCLKGHEAWLWAILAHLEDGQDGEDEDERDSLLAVIG